MTEISITEWRGPDGAAPPSRGDCALPIAGAAAHAATLTCDETGTLLLQLRSPRPLRLWLDGALLLEEDLFWRSFQRQLRAAVLVPLEAGEHRLRAEFGDRPRHHPFVDAACPSRNREAVLAAVAARYPDMLALDATLAPPGGPALSLRYLPQQHVADDMVWQHALVRPLAVPRGAPSTEHASPADRPAPMPFLRTPLGEARAAPRAAEVAHGYQRYHLPVFAAAASPPPARSAGDPDDRPEPVQTVTDELTLWAGDGRIEHKLALPVFEPLGRLAPHRAYRALAWPDAARLRAAAPTPVLPPALAPLAASYEAGWAMFADLVTEAAADSGLPNGFLTTGANFLHWQFVWDTAFGTLCTRYAHRAFPVTASLDVLYSRQLDGGYIHRQHDVRDGSPALFEPDFSPNPPILSLAELEIARITGDVARLHRVYPVLVDHHRWLAANRRLADGSYWTSGLASGLDNAPSLAEGYPDLTAQMAQDAEALADIATLIGRGEDAGRWRAERDATGAALNARLWSDELGFYTGRRADGTHNPKLIVSGFWPLWAGLADAERVERLCAHLTDPAAFARPHPVPSLAADASSFRPEGRYWLGSVWPPTNYMVVTGLARAGRHDLGRAIALKHLEQVEAVRAATGKLWENYSSETAAPGSPAGPDYVWSALGPVALLLEVVIGLTPDAPARTVAWRVPNEDGIGVRGYRLGRATLDLVHRRAGGRRWLEVATDRSVTLLLDDGERAQALALAPGGRVLTPWGDAPPSPFA